MKAHQAEFPIKAICRLLGVSTSGYYAWTSRSPSARKMEDQQLAEHIRAIHTRSRGTYGVPRIHAELQELGVRISGKRVARLMRQDGLEGVSRRRKPVTTVRRPADKIARDLVERNFSVTAPNRLWVADITYIPTLAGVLYLGVILDVFSRRVIGWSMAATRSLRPANPPGVTSVGSCLVLCIEYLLPIARRSQLTQKDLVCFTN